MGDDRAPGAILRWLYGRVATLRYDMRAI